jgi:hypothetical protein
VKLTVPVIRDVLLLTIGSGSLVNQLFLVQDPSILLISVSLLSILGSAVINAYWLKLPSQPATETTPVVPLPPPSPSPSSSSGSS